MNVLEDDSLVQWQVSTRKTQNVQNSIPGDSVSFFKIDILFEILFDL
jgi:hypothetical protein